MEAERSDLLRQGPGAMTHVLSRWIDPKLMARSPRAALAGCVFLTLPRPCRGCSSKSCKAPCRDVGQHVQATRVAEDATIPDSSTAAYCQTRAKLPMKRRHPINEARKRLLPALSGKNVL